MAIVTKTSGYYIIGDSLIILPPGAGLQVSYRDDKPVQIFATEAEARAAHEAQFPAQYQVPAQ